MIYPELGHEVDDQVFKDAVAFFEKNIPEGRITK
jgi:hypothetical protein